DLNKEFFLRFQEFLMNRKLHVNNCCGIVRYICTGINKAVADGYMNDNPVSKIPKESRFRLKKATPKFLSLEQIEHLAQTGQNIPDQFKLAFFLCCFCGVRWVDCYRLKWNQIITQIIDGKPISVLFIEQEKTKLGVYIPLSEQALSIIAQRKQATKKELSSPFVFPYLCYSEKYTTNYARMAYCMKKWQKQSDIHVHFHKARHTFATLTLSQGADLYTVSKLLGHSDIKHTMIYARVVDRLKVQAVANLPMIKGDLLVKSGNELIAKDKIPAKTNKGDSVSALDAISKALRAYNPTAKNKVQLNANEVNNRGVLNAISKALVEFNNVIGQIDKGQISDQNLVRKSKKSKQNTTEKRTSKKRKAA
ncbi:MAG: tyrosine-type recombinase/integrase, partial [Bacteroidia bacterium]